MSLPKLTTSTHRLKLPSTGKVFNFRPYLVKEEKILMMAMESESEIEMINAVKNVITSCTNGELTGSQMTMFDLEYFFTQLRAKSVGEQTKVYLPCKNCEHKQKVGIDISKANVINVPPKASDYIKTIIDPQDSKNGESVKIKLGYPKIDSLIEILEHSKDLSPIDLSYEFIVSSIEEIYFGDEIYDAREQSKKELMEFVESMNSKQFLEIRKFIEDGPVVVIDHDFKCEKCGHENAYRLKGLTNFFG